MLLCCAPLPLLFTLMIQSCSLTWIVFEFRTLILIRDHPLKVLTTVVGNHPNTLIRASADRKTLISVMSSYFSHIVKFQQVSVISTAGAPGRRVGRTRGAIRANSTSEARDRDRRNSTS